MELKQLLKQKILVLDGAMGTMLQGYDLQEADFRGDRFQNHPLDLKGNHDVLTLTRPDVLRAVHEAYLDAGADILETNTFAATAIAQADYQLDGDVVVEINREAARIAREAADQRTAQTPEKPRFVFGVLGPTNRSASISPDVNDPGFRNITFEELSASYRSAAEALLIGGAHAILVETIFDTLNAKAAIFGLKELEEKRGTPVPIVISGTITDASGRTLSGQTTEAFYNSICHADPLAVGLNCALGAEELRPYVQALSRVATTHVSAHPNAGLPNEFGEYDQTPEAMASLIREFAQAGLPQPHWGLLRNDPGPYPSHRGSGGGLAAATDSRSAEADATFWIGAAGDRSRLIICKYRGADQRHRFRSLSKVDQSGRLRFCPRSRPRSGRKRRPAGGREHG